MFQQRRQQGKFLNDMQIRRKVEQVRDVVDRSFEDELIKEVLENVDYDVNAAVIALCEMHSAPLPVSSSSSMDLQMIACGLLDCGEVKKDCKNSPYEGGTFSQGASSEGSLSTSVLPSSNTKTSETFLPGASSEGHTTSTASVFPSTSTNTKTLNDPMASSILFDYDEYDRMLSMQTSYVPSPFPLSPVTTNLQTVATSSSSSPTKPPPMGMARSSPMQSHQPQPTSMIHSSPMQSHQPQPMSMIRGSPMQSHQPRPISMTRSSPMQSHQPQPISMTRSSPMQSHQPQPMSMIRGSPMQSHQPQPMIMTRSSPMQRHPVTPKPNASLSANAPTFVPSWSMGPPVFSFPAAQSFDPKYPSQVNKPTKSSGRLDKQHVNVPQHMLRSGSAPALPASSLKSTSTLSTSLKSTPALSTSLKSTPALSTALKSSPALSSLKSTPAVPTSLDIKESGALQRIEKLGLYGCRVMILMRGLPGSGKSYLARQVKCNGQIFSTDDFFWRGTTYEFTPQDLSEAHEWNRLRVEKALKDGITPVVVDNTNVCMWEMIPYALMGYRMCYCIEVLEPDTPWRNKPKELAKFNQHGVPVETINRMKNKYFEIDTAKLLAHTQKKFEELELNRCASAPSQNQSTAGVPRVSPQDRPSNRNRLKVISQLGQLRECLQIFGADVKGMFFKLSRQECDAFKEMWDFLKEKKLLNCWINEVILIMYMSDECESNPISKLMDLVKHWKSWYERSSGTQSTSQKNKSAVVDRRPIDKNSNTYTRTSLVKAKQESSVNIWSGETRHSVGRESESKTVGGGKGEETSQQIARGGLNMEKVSGGIPPKVVKTEKVDEGISAPVLDQAFRLSWESPKDQRGGREEKTSQEIARGLDMEKVSGGISPKVTKTEKISEPVSRPAWEDPKGQRGRKRTQSGHGQKSETEESDLKMGVQEDKTLDDGEKMVAGTVNVEDYDETAGSEESEQSSCNEQYGRNMSQTQRDDECVTVNSSTEADSGSTSDAPWESENSSKPEADLEKVDKVDNDNTTKTETTSENVSETESDSSDSVVILEEVDMFFGVSESSDSDAVSAAETNMETVSAPQTEEKVEEVSVFENLETVSVILEKLSLVEKTVSDVEIESSKTADPKPDKSGNNAKWSGLSENSASVELSGTVSDRRQKVCVRSLVPYSSSSSEDESDDQPEQVEKEERATEEEFFTALDNTPSPFITGKSNHKDIESITQVSDCITPSPLESIVPPTKQLFGAVADDTTTSDSSASTSPVKAHKRRRVGRKPFLDETTKTQFFASWKNFGADVLHRTRQALEAEDADSEGSTDTSEVRAESEHKAGRTDCAAMCTQTEGKDFAAADRIMKDGNPEIGQEYRVVVANADYVPCSSIDAAEQDRPVGWKVMRDKCEMVDIPEEATEDWLYEVFSNKLPQCILSFCVDLFEGDVAGAMEFISDLDRTTSVTLYDTEKLQIEVGRQKSRVEAADHSPTTHEENSPLVTSLFGLCMKQVSNMNIPDLDLRIINSNNQREERTRSSELQRIHSLKLQDENSDDSASDGLPDNFCLEDFTSDESPERQLHAELETATSLQEQNVDQFAAKPDQDAENEEELRAQQHLGGARPKIKMLANIKLPSQPNFRPSFLPPSVQQPKLGQLTASPAPLKMLSTKPPSQPNMQPSFRLPFQPAKITPNREESSVLQMSASGLVASNVFQHSAAQMFRDVEAAPKELTLSLPHGFLQALQEIFGYLPGTSKPRSLPLLLKVDHLTGYHLYQCLKKTLSSETQHHSMEEADRKRRQIADDELYAKFLQENEEVDMKLQMIASKREMDTIRPSCGQELHLPQAAASVSATSGLADISPTDKEIEALVGRLSLSLPCEFLEDLQRLFGNLPDTSYLPSLDVVIKLNHCTALALYECARKSLSPAIVFEEQPKQASQVSEEDATNQQTKQDFDQEAKMKQMDEDAALAWLLANENVDIDSQRSALESFSSTTPSGSTRAIPDRSKKTHYKASFPQTKPTAQPVSLLAIIEEEKLKQEREEEERKRSEVSGENEAIATILKLRKLHQHFPHCDKQVLAEVFRSNNYNMELTGALLESATGSMQAVSHKLPMSKVSKSSHQELKEEEQEQDIWDAHNPDISYRDLRAEAQLHDTLKAECFRKASEYYHKSGPEWKTVASVFADQARFHCARKYEANMRAADLMLEKRRPRLEDENTLDLHGFHVDEAIDILSRVIAEKEKEFHCKPVQARGHMYVITGRGRHSQNQQARIRPAVMEHLKRVDYRFEECNLGKLKISLRPPM